jgi:frataxin-like iron-binding protein CyaY
MVVWMLIDLTLAWLINECLESQPEKRINRMPDDRECSVKCRCGGYGYIRQDEEWVECRQGLALKDAMYAV